MVPPVRAWFWPVVALLFAAWSSRSAEAGWMTLKNDSNRVLVVQETVVAKDGTLKRGKPIRLLPGETLREFQAGPTVKRVEIYDLQVPAKAALQRQAQLQRRQRSVLDHLRRQGHHGGPGLHERHRTRPHDSISEEVTTAVTTLGRFEGPLRLLPIKRSPPAYSLHNDSGRCPRVNPSGAAMLAPALAFLAFSVSSALPQITTAAGTGVKGYSGDGGPAASATLNQPFDLTFDKQGNLFFSDTGNHRDAPRRCRHGAHRHGRGKRREGLLGRRRACDRGRPE